MPPLVVGLTGGIGSGKSEVARRFQALGAAVVDADDVARQVVEPGTPALNRIAEHFGSRVFTPEGGLDRACLRGIIFTDPDEKQWLEALLHPIINQHIVQQLTAASSPYALLVSPLLLETGQDKMVHRVLVVDVSEANQLARAGTRDRVEPSQIEAIMASQMSRTERLERADDVIRNEGDLSELDGQVAELHKLYLELAG